MVSKPAGVVGSAVTRGVVEVAAVTDKVEAVIDACPVPFDEAHPAQARSAAAASNERNDKNISLPLLIAITRHEPI